MFPRLTTQFYGNLSIVGVTHSPDPQSLFLYEWVGNFEFEFCKNTEDKFNGICYVTLILLSFMHISRDDKFYWHLVGVKWGVVLFALSRCVEVACKELSLIQ